MNTHWAATVSAPQQPTMPTASMSCICGDPQVERLRDMVAVAAGWDQAAASRVIWGPADPAVLVRPRGWGD